MEMDKRLILAQRVFDLLGDSGFTNSECEAALEITRTMLIQRVFPAEYRDPVRPPSDSDLQVEPDVRS